MSGAVSKVIPVPVELGFFTLFGNLSQRWGLTSEDSDQISARLREAIASERSERFTSTTDPTLYLHHQTWRAHSWPYATDHMRVELKTGARSLGGLKLQVTWNREDCDGVMNSEEHLEISVQASGEDAQGRIEAFENWVVGLALFDDT